MPASKLTRRLFWGGELLLLAGTVSASVWITSADEWRPLSLVVLLLALSLVGKWFSVETSGGHADSLLRRDRPGDWPFSDRCRQWSAAIAAMVLHSAIGRRPPAQWLNNLTTFAITPFVGGLMVVRIGRRMCTTPRNQHLTHGVVFGLIVLLFLVVSMIGLNFVLFALDVRLDDGRSLSASGARTVPSAAARSARDGDARGHSCGRLSERRHLGAPSRAVAVLLILQHLTVALLRSEDTSRAARSTLDPARRPAARRSANAGAGARHARQDERRDTPATVATLCAGARRPSSAAARRSATWCTPLAYFMRSASSRGPIVSCAPRSSQEEDLAIVKNHPQEGAILVGALDGYGEVADAILYHHERVDGRRLPCWADRQRDPACLPDPRNLLDL